MIEINAHSNLIQIKKTKIEEVVTLMPRTWAGDSSLLQTVLYFSNTYFTSIYLVISRFTTYSIPSLYDTTADLALTNIFF